MSAINRARFLLASACVCAAGTSLAQGLCFPVAPSAESAPPPAAPVAATGLIELLTGEFELRPNNIIELTDEVNARYRNGILTMDAARFDQTSSTLEIVGRGAYTSPEFTVFGEDAVVDLGARQAVFNAAGFELFERPARGSGQMLEVDDDDRISLMTAVFTTCPAEQTTWELLARDLDLDLNAGYGTARGVKLEFKGVPIFYTPYFTFPIDDRRKRGFLTPAIAERDRSGLELLVPYYFNLAPNYDLLLEPRFLSERGLQIGNEFRYLLPRSDGVFELQYLPDDDAYGDSRSYVDLEHRSSFGVGWQLLTSLEEVSDDNYFEDLGFGVGVTSQTHLNRFIDLSFFAANWSLLTRLQNYQTIDEAIAADDLPYERLPQMLFRGGWGRQLLGFESTTELVYFDRDVGTTGWRFDSTNELSLRFNRRGMYLTPAVAMRQTSYWLDDVAPQDDDDLRRTLPIASVDAGLRFERLSESSSWIQTLEPRLLYVYVPFEDQSRLPVFDTIVPDFNLVQLFRKYQYVGPDRVADTDQVSIGVTTRLIRAATGRERLTASFGQTRYLAEQRVELPGQPPPAGDSSDYIAELSLYLSNRWNVDVAYQWDDDTRSTERAETRFEYRPQPDRLFGLGYRYRPGLLEQGDLAVVWPVTQRWRVVGSYRYSLLDDQPLEQSLGWEYEACCWRLRLFGRRYISSRDGREDTSVSIQLGLNGFSDGGRSPDELLDRGILGYRSFE